MLLPANDNGLPVRTGQQRSPPADYRRIIDFSECANYSLPSYAGLSLRPSHPHRWLEIADAQIRDTNVAVFDLRLFNGL